MTDTRDLTFEGYTMQEIKDAIGFYGGQIADSRRRCISLIANIKAIVGQEGIDIFYIVHSLEIDTRDLKTEQRKMWDATRNRDEFYRRYFKLKDLYWMGGGEQNDAE